MTSAATRGKALWAFAHGQISREKLAEELEVNVADVMDLHQPAARDASGAPTVVSRVSGTGLEIHSPAAPSAAEAQIVEAYLAVETALAKRILGDWNCDRAAANDWPGGQTWDDLGQTSHERLWSAARKEAGLPTEAAFKNAVILGAAPSATAGEAPEPAGELARIRRRVDYDDPTPGQLYGLVNHAHSVATALLKDRDRLAQRVEALQNGLLEMISLAGGVLTVEQSDQFQALLAGRSPAGEAP